MYDNVKSIYLEKMSSNQDTVIIKKMYWKPGRYFQTITQKATGHTKPVTEMVKVVWDTGIKKYDANRISEYCAHYTAATRYL